MKHYLLVINAGSSSIKFAAYSVEQPGTELKVNLLGLIEGIGKQAVFTVQNADAETLLERTLPVDDAADHANTFLILLSWLKDYLATGTLLAIGHRIVHGGTNYLSPVLIDEKVLTDLENLIPLAPLHQPQSLSMIRTIRAIMPDLPQVACFDTAFHHTQPGVAKMLALPRRFIDEGLCRYGFHGLSYEYICSVLPSLAPSLAEARIIIAHLGNGASLCAVKERRSIATTMGFSPLDGLVMSTRCGSIDPGALLYLMNRHNMGAEALTQCLYHQSGLLGVSCVSDDMRTLLASNDPHADEAIELFVYRAGREIGSLAAALGGVDALIFTGGIGEHSAEIRARICRQSEWLGLQLDVAANEAASQCISTPDSSISAWIVETDENAMIACHTLSRISTN